MALFGLSRVLPVCRFHFFCSWTLFSALNPCPSITHIPTLSSLPSHHKDSRVKTHQMGRLIIWILEQWSILSLCNIMVNLWSPIQKMTNIQLSYHAEVCYSIPSRQVPFRYSKSPRKLFTSFPSLGVCLVISCQLSASIIGSRQIQHEHINLKIRFVSKISSKTIWAD